jgi:hypothetical protein
VGDERAETYLRLLAETQLRLGVTPWQQQIDHGRSVLRELSSAGDILVAAGLIDEEFTDGLVTDVETALAARSRAFRERYGRRRRIFSTWQRAPRPPSRVGGPPRITAVGQKFSVPNDRAPSDVHLLTLVRGASETAIIAVIRMRWPEDGSSADLEMTGAGVHHFPYGKIGGVDDRGADYRLDFDGDGGTHSWQGVVRLLPPPPPGTRWVDLIADDTNRLARVELDPPAPEFAAPELAAPELAAPEIPVSGPARVEARAGALAAIEVSAGVPIAERLLAVEAEGLLAEAWNRPGATVGPELGRITTVLADAGAITADHPLLGQLADLCRRLHVAAHGITARPASIPGPWADIIAQANERAAGLPPFLAARGPDICTPLVTGLPDIDGMQLALAGLSSAVSDSYLFAVASGLRPPGRRYQDGWRPGLSWWLKDPAGRWHLAVAADYLSRSAEVVVIPLRLIPPLAAYPDTIEVVVTGTSARVSAVVPVPGAPERDRAGAPEAADGGH